jgi:hypothetical protein
MTKQYFSALLTAVAYANIRVGVFSDLHYNEIYNPATSANNCKNTTSDKNGDLYAPIGRYGCDPSEALINHMIARFKEKFGAVDVIIVPGDSVAHKVSAATGGTDLGGVAYAAVK